MDILSSFNPGNFTINGRSKKFLDVQRDFMWQMVIPGVKDITPSALFDAEDLLVRCRSISIPARSNEPITSNWMGTKQFTPGRPEVGGEVSVEFEETEDMAISRILYEWQQVIFNINPDSPISAGKSQRLQKRFLVKDIYLFMFNFAGLPLPKAIRFHNAWVKGVSDTPLNYEGSNAVKYTATFQYDFWTQFPDSTTSLYR